MTQGSWRLAVGHADCAWCPTGRRGGHEEDGPAGQGTCGGSGALCHRAVRFLGPGGPAVRQRRGAAAGHSGQAGGPSCSSAIWVLSGACTGSLPNREGEFPAVAGFTRLQLLPCLLTGTPLQMYIRHSQGRLSDAQVDDVIQRMKPLLRQQRYGEALRRVRRGTGHAVIVAGAWCCRRRRRLRAGAGPVQAHWPSWRSAACRRPCRALQRQAACLPNLDLKADWCTRRQSQTWASPSRATQGAARTPAAAPTGACTSCWPPWLASVASSPGASLPALLLAGVRASPAALQHSKGLWPGWARAAAMQQGAGLPGAASGQSPGTPAAACAAADRRRALCAQIWHRLIQVCTGRVWRCCRAQVTKSRRQRRVGDLLSKLQREQDIARTQKRCAAATAQDRSCGRSAARARSLSGAAACTNLRVARTNPPCALAQSCPGVLPAVQAHGLIVSTSGPARDRSRMQVPCRVVPHLL